MLLTRSEVQEAVSSVPSRSIAENSSVRSAFGPRYPSHLPSHREVEAVYCAGKRNDDRAVVAAAGVEDGGTFVFVADENDGLGSSYADCHRRHCCSHCKRLSGGFGISGRRRQQQCWMCMRENLIKL